MPVQRANKCVIWDRSAWERRQNLGVCCGAHVCTHARMCMRARVRVRGDACMRACEGMLSSCAVPDAPERTVGLRVRHQSCSLEATCCCCDGEVRARMMHHRAWGKSGGVAAAVNVTTRCLVCAPSHLCNHHAVAEVAGNVALRSRQWYLVDPGVQ